MIISRCPSNWSLILKLDVSCCLCGQMLVSRNPPSHLGGLEWGRHDTQTLSDWLRYHFSCTSDWSKADVLCLSNFKSALRWGLCFFNVVSVFRRALMYLDCLTMTMKLWLQIINDLISQWSCLKAKYFWIIWPYIAVK